MKETLVDQARKTLTFVLGHFRTLQELIDFVPKERENFLNYLPRQELQAIDEERGIPQPRKGDWRRFFILKRQSSALSEDNFRRHSVANSIPDIDQPDGMATVGRNTTRTFEADTRTRHKNVQIML
jgi:hypothetical protein